MANEQRQRSQAPSEAVPLTDDTVTDGGVPLAFVLIGLTVPLALVLAAGKPVLAHARHRRPPANVA